MKGGKMPRSQELIKQRIKHGIKLRLFYSRDKILDEINLILWDIRHNESLPNSKDIFFGLTSIRNKIITLRLNHEAIDNRRQRNIIKKTL